MPYTNNIHAVRKQNNLTLEELADKVGVSKQTIQRYETGQISNIPPTNIAKMAEVMKTSPSYLIGWETKDPTQSTENMLSNILKKAMIERGITSNALARAIHLDQRSVSSYVTGRRLPPLNILNDILSYLQIDFTDLFHLSSPSMKSHQNIEECIDAFIREPAVADYLGYEVNELSKQEKEKLTAIFSSTLDLAKTFLD